MSISDHSRVGREVEADFVELVDPDGHKHYLGRGRMLPDWVDHERVAELVAAGAVAEYGVL